MAHWHTEETVYIGDAFGNPVQAKVGVVTVNKRTTFGIQINRDNPQDQPDYTADLTALSDLRSAIDMQRSALIRVTGGMQ